MSADYGAEPAGAGIPKAAGRGGCRMEYQVHKQGKRVFLRPLSLEDSPLVVRWRNNPRVRENYIFREPFTLEGQEAYYRDVIQAGKAVQAVICEKKTGMPAGCCVLNHLDFARKQCEFGFFIGEDSARGKHFSSEAAHLMLDYAFTDLSMTRAYSRIFVFNAPSLKGTGGSGFVIAGRCLKVRCTDGFCSDMYMSECLKDNFYGKQNG